MMRRVREAAPVPTAAAGGVSAAWQGGGIAVRAESAAYHHDQTGGLWFQIYHRNLQKSRW